MLHPQTAQTPLQVNPLPSVVDAQDTHCVHVGLIDASGLNPRKTFDPEKLGELSANIYARTVFNPDGSVQLTGVLLPLIVRPKGNGRYEIAAGERRWRAVRALMQGVTVRVGDQDMVLKVNAQDYPVPIIVRSLTDAELVEVASIENLLRDDLSELEEADACLTLYNLGKSKAEIASKYGASDRTVERRLTLAAGLGRDGRKMLEKGQINITQAFILAQITGPLKQTLLKACREGMTVRELQKLVTKGTVLVQHAIFDVEASGLTVAPKLFDDGLPDRFNDPKAALSAQLDALEKRAGALREQGIHAFVDIAAFDGTYGLPDGYVMQGNASSGLLLTYNPATGEVTEYPDVQRVSEQVTAKASRAPSPAPRPTDPGSANAVTSSAPPRKHAAVKEGAYRLALSARSEALARGMLANPRVALVNAVVQMLSVPGHIRLSVTPVREHMRQTPEAQAFAERMVAEFPQLFRSTTPGTLFAHADPVALLDTVMGWPDALLMDMLSFLCGGMVGEAQPGEEVSLYTRRVAQLTGADQALSREFTLTATFLEDFTLEGLHALVNEIPEQLRPIVLVNTSKHEIRALLLERAATLRRIGWLPSMVKF